MSLLNSAATRSSKRARSAATSASSRNATNGSTPAAPPVPRMATPPLAEDLHPALGAGGRYSALEDYAMVMAMAEYGEAFRAALEARGRSHRETRAVRRKIGDYVRTNVRAHAGGDAETLRHVACYQDDHVDAHREELLQRMASALRT